MAADPSVNESQAQASTSNLPATNGGHKDKQEDRDYTPRRRRSTHTSRRSASTGLPFEQALPPSTSSSPFVEQSHVGAAALKRVFIGPHFVGQSAFSSGKGKGRAADQEDLDSDDDDDSSSSSTDDDDEGGGDDDGSSQRGGNVLDRARARGGQRLPTSETIHGGIKATGSRKSSVHKWVGGSFEIGGDVREASARRERARQRRASEASATKDSPTIAATHAANTFVTAKTHQAPDADNYRLRQPPQAVEESLPPALVHNLMRRPSDVPSDSASLPTAPVRTLDHAQEPMRSILRASKDGKTNGSALGNGYPSSPAISPPSVRSLPVAPVASGHGLKPSTTSNVKFSSQQHPQHAAPDGDLPPVPVEEVLARPDEVTFEEGVPIVRKRRLGRNEVLRKERMLMRVDWSPREDLPDHFDENSARKFPTRHEGWVEMAVVHYPNRIELYTEHKVTAAAFYLNQKKLKHTIPLSLSRTKLSLYSSPDAVFCLTYRPSPNHKATNLPTDKAGGAPMARDPENPTSGGDDDDGDTKRSKAASKRAYVHFRHTGTNIYIFRTKTKVIAKEWMWELWRKLGGALPRTLDITVPYLDAKIRIPIPIDLPVRTDEGYLFQADREGEGYRLCTPSAVVKLCLERLSRIESWRHLLDMQRDSGQEFVLAWRRGGVLDWVESRENATEYSVVVGFAMRQVHIEPSLELRLALHYPTTVKMPESKAKSAVRLVEPPGIEGYLTRVKTKGVNDRVYLSSHDGHLFVCRPSSAHPPEPPAPIARLPQNPAELVLTPLVMGFATIGANEQRKRKRDAFASRINLRSISGASSKQDMQTTTRALKSMQGSSTPGGQIDDDGEDDLLAVLDRQEKIRAYQQITNARGFVDLQDVVDVRVATHEGEIDAAEGILDIGGPDGLAVSEDKALLLRQRSFVINLKGGATVTFECHSIAVRQEWVGRLQALITYWRRRAELDAIEQMELTSPQPRRPHPSSAHTDHPRDHDMTAPPDPTLLSKVYNFCRRELCRPIIASGRFYVKRGLRGMFKERYLMLLAGTLIEYQVFDRDIHGQPLPSVYHRHISVLSLRGCYVYSGRLAAHLLSPHSGTSWDPADSQHRFPRLYPADKLRVSDDEEDCTLVIFKRPFGGNGRFGKQGKIRVLRARSQIERDEWVAALNNAIEKLASSEQDREERIKAFPWLKHRD